jgi:Zn-dependent peptidase ImmA (M78 family)/transcriptional regulator with XRE-family HTH domain
MSPSERIAVVPDVIIWARESAGLAPDQAAKKLTVSVSTLEGWETGETPPTIKQLRKAAKTYRRPLAVLLLPSPPTDFLPLQDFRRSSAVERSKSPELISEIKRALTQREVFLELAEVSPTSFATSKQIPTIDQGMTAEAAGASLRDSLGLDLFPQSIWSRPAEALNRCIRVMENLGVIVIQTQGIEIEELRGFSISDAPYPVIALNGKDFPRPRIFTLFHELTHLALRAGGLCDLHEAQRSSTSARDNTEHYCNSVAASILMPAETFLSQANVRASDADYDWSLDELSQLSARFGASSEAVLLRLISLSKASWETYWVRKLELEEEYADARRRLKQQQRESQGGPSYYVIKARDMGHGYIITVLDAFRSRAITSLDVADYLDVRYDQLSKLEQATSR